MWFFFSISGKCKPKLRILSLPVLCRLNQMSAVDNNKKQVVIFGHPGLVQVPNQVSAKELYRLLRPLMPITDKEVPHLVSRREKKPNLFTDVRSLIGNFDCGYITVWKFRNFSSITDFTWNQVWLISEGRKLLFFQLWRIWVFIFFFISIFFKCHTW